MTATVANSHLARLRQDEPLVLSSLLRVELNETGLFASFHQEKLRAINERNIFALGWDAEEDCRPSDALLEEMVVLLAKLARLMTRLRLEKFARNLDYSIIIYYTPSASEEAALALLRLKSLNTLQKLLMLSSFFNAQPDMTKEQLLFYGSRKLLSFATLFTSLEKNELHRLLKLAEYGLFGAEAGYLLWHWTPVYHPDGSPNVRGNSFQEFQLMHDFLRFLHLKSKLYSWEAFQKLTPEELPLTYIPSGALPRENISVPSKIIKLLALPEARLLLQEDFLACMKVQASFPEELYGYLLKTYGDRSKRETVPAFQRYAATQAHPLAYYLPQQDHAALESYCELHSDLRDLRSPNSDLIGLILMGWLELPPHRFQEFFSFLRRHSTMAPSNNTEGYYLLSDYSKYPVASYLWAMEQDSTVAFSLLMELAPGSNHV